MVLATVPSSLRFWHAFPHQVRSGRAFWGARAAAPASLAQLPEQRPRSSVFALLAAAALKRVIKSLQHLRRRIISGRSAAVRSPRRARHERAGSCTWLPPHAAPHRTVVSSASNPAFRELKCLVERRAERQRRRRFVAEGLTFLRMRPRAVFVRKSRWLEMGSEIEASLERGGEEGIGTSSSAATVPWHAGPVKDSGRAGEPPSVCILSDELFDRATRGTSKKVAQGVISVFALPMMLEETREITAGAETTRNTGPHVVILDGVRDPQNVGVILRTMEAFGVSTLVSLRNSIDVYDRKVVRCSMGAAMRGRVKCMEVEDASALRALLEGYQIFAAMPCRDGGIESCSLTQHVTGRDAFMFGGPARCHRWFG
mmetsp:Transcript_1029/g.3208  ORF Transcript_1029/g.3208 Transcript_1029/m.3208 type:complete len:371 (+) Transcript_1029:49-1161(+)